MARIKEIGRKLSLFEIEYILNRYLAILRFFVPYISPQNIIFLFYIKFNYIWKEPIKRLQIKSPLPFGISRSFKREKVFH